MVEGRKALQDGKYRDTSCATRHLLSDQAALSGNHQIQRGSALVPNVTQNEDLHFKCRGNSPRTLQFLASRRKRVLAH